VDESKHKILTQNNKNNIVRVAIQRPLYKLLDYSCADQSGANGKQDLTPRVGCRVRVPLGNTVITAIVVETQVESEFEKLKAILEVLDKEPLLDSSMMELLNWASRYYCYPIGEVLFHALPITLRKGKPLPTSLLWKASEQGQSCAENELKRAPKQLAFLQRLKQSECTESQLRDDFSTNWRNTLRELKKKGLVESREVDTTVKPQTVLTSIPEKGNLVLSDEQQSSIQSISDSFQKNATLPILLHGITGSGKTEVYLRAITPLLEAGKQVLVLVPEIGLTPQLLFRFKEHFPNLTINAMHSGLADGERVSIWQGARSGEINIIIGTRSAVFTPMNNLGAILIDEEHDASFKQQEGFLYQGRDMAVKRAHHQGIPILLGSATPSIESLENVNQGRYQYLRLRSRPGKSKPPEMALLDTRTLALEAGISQLLMSEVRQHIEQNNQVMLFLNRRGFAPIIMCPSCGWHASCQHCDSGMTYHAFASKVICHHCGLEEKISQKCPDCGSPKLTTQGQGTERIEQVLKTHFPKTNIIRIDRDSTSSKGALEKKLKQVHAGEPVILIGTQMLTKGHDFPNLTLVGILDVDQALFSLDYRAQERLAQQVVQVAGRAGRGEKKGRVVLQTSQPEHPLLLSLLSKGYKQTAEQILNERGIWDYPPVGALAIIKANAESSDVAAKFLLKLNVQLSAYIEANSKLFESVNTMGPMPSPIQKRAKRYRFQYLITAKNRLQLHRLLNQAQAELSSFRRTGGVRWAIDVDPSDFL
jgi:primosomal protein N' (replication factor Y)